MSVHFANGVHNSYQTLMALVRNTNLSDIWNLTLDGIDFVSPEDLVTTEMITNLPAVRAFFYCLYIIVFVVGICGNVLVCYVVFRNKSMHTVTNLFIANLALSDILLCTFAVMFTPLYMYITQWVFGRVMCHLLPYAQGVSVYISAFTLMAIAIDRFFVIIYPFKARLQVSVCCWTILLVWLTAGMLTMPYGIFMKLVEIENKTYCEEGWPSEYSRRAFGFCTSILQFVIPFIIISFCYIRVCAKLRDRARAKPGAKSLKKEELERERTRRTNRMLITMVVIFGVSWLPLNVYNLVVDFYIPATSWTYLNAVFFLSHATAMSSTCYNPFLYAWLNENFRKEFKTVLPCFTSPAAGGKRIPSARNERTCNGRETAQESLLPRNNSLTDGQKATAVKYVSATDSVRLQIARSEIEVI